ncbi:uncharacterized protein LOC108052538 [Drosophila rhopaloa]|uniref:Uncharacterized protein n=1 Tax=Drosophila rhopaloa TaxID=1041015 RepID=A0ABM5I5G2_DRORH|nr:uncharacterized protein LOC108052538 [Drosophila rhopaloa]
MSSSKSSEKPTTSSALQTQNATERVTHGFDDIDKRLEMLLARVTTLESSLNKLNFTIKPGSGGVPEDTDEELEALQDELDAQEHQLSDLAEEEDIEEKEEFDHIEELTKENAEN